MMADRETVLNGLECCIEWDSCNKCPYETPNEYDIAECTLSLRTDALALLKEQEAIKIEVKKINNSGRCGRCPNCLMELNEMDYPNHCGYCGQKVKWDG